MPVLALQRPTKASKWGLDGAHTERPVEKLPSIFERGAKTFRMPETYERRGAREAPWRERSTRLAASRAADGFPQKSFAGEESDVEPPIAIPSELQLGAVDEIPGSAVLRQRASGEGSGEGWDAEGWDTESDVTLTQRGQQAYPTKPSLRRQKNRVFLKERRHRDEVGSLAPLQPPSHRISASPI